MNGAESLVHTARAAGVEVCFANPGTTEMPLVVALDSVPGVRAVLGLFEGVCTGAADGWSRMRGRPALTLLHLGPGLANGLANLHNARRARSPMVNLIGDHATWHQAADAPLASDIASLAAPVSCFVRSSATARDLAGDAADAIAASLRAPGGVASLIVPADCQWGEAAGPAAWTEPPAPPPVTDAAVARAAEALRGSGPSILMLGGRALSARGLREAERVAAACGARLVAEGFAARLERGAGLPAPERLPYFPEQAVAFLKGTVHVVLAGATEPVAFFGYPDGPSRLVPPGTRTALLARPEDDVVEALAALAERLGAPTSASLPRRAAAPEQPAAPGGALNPDALGRALAALQPEGAIVVEEGATSGVAYALHAAAAPPHTALGLTGGAIGQGLPCATGAAVACPERRVIALQADGSGMYTVQALWTQARESLDVTTVVCANRAYRILRVELARAGVAEPGPQALALTDLGRPVLDWVALARGLGVPGVRVESADELVAALRRSLAEPGPTLIEAVL
jgi:acetolactate synthase-1/2/3 large subunit